MDATRREAGVVVVGAGVIGLTTAWRLRELGREVEVWSRDDPLATTSAVAGAIWYPFLAEPRERVLGWSRVTYERLAQLAKHTQSGVRMQQVVEVFSDPDPELWWREAVPRVQRLPAEDVPPPHAAAVRVEVPVCDVPVHLQWMIEELGQRGVTIRRRRISSLDEAFAVAGTVVNCSGLGSVQLCQDEEMQPVRGQVVVCDGEPVPYAWIDDTAARPCYVIPRGDVLVLGGTAQKGDTRLTTDAADTEAIVAGAVRRFPGLQRARIRSVAVGLRPYRSTVRLEAEARDGRRLVHNYGHGGSGWTLAWGCADEAAALVTG